MREAINTAIYNKLNSIEGIKEVYKYNKGHFTKYPVAVILGSESEKEFESVKTIMKTYRFTVQVLQEINEEARGMSAGEEILIKLSDTIENAFDEDDELGGVVDDVNVSGAFIYEDREVQQRVLELTIECKKLKQLT